MVYIWEKNLRIWNFVTKTYIAANNEAAAPSVPIGWVEAINTNVFRSPPWLGWPLWKICVTNDNRYFPLVVNTSRSFPHAWLITGFVNSLTRRVPLVEQELLTLPEHMSSAPFLVRLVLLDRCLSFRSFSLNHCVICPSSINGFW